MILFCEINKTDQEHVMINSCLLKMISDYSRTQELELWIDKSHYQHFLFKPVGINIKYTTVVKPEKSNKLRWLWKIVSEIFIISNIILSALLKNVHLIFFSSLSPVGNWYLSFISSITPGRLKFVITMHGELTLASKTQHDKQIEGIYGRLLRNSFSRRNANVRYLLLNAVIRKNVIAKNLLNEDQIIYIEHPYMFSQTNNVITRKDNLPIIFGHLGVAKLDKHSEKFFRLAERFKDYVLNGTVQFIVVGQVLDDMNPFLNDYVLYQKSNEFISKEQYSIKASTLSYSVFFYDEDTYAFTSSGALLDSISYSTPILALKVETFNILFSLENGDPGFLVDNYDEMCLLVEKLISKPHSEYINLVNSIEERKKFFTVEAQYSVLKTQLDNFLYNHGSFS